MKHMLAAILFLGCAVAVRAGMTPVIEITGPDGHAFREIPVAARDGAMRSYLEA
jgi:hypothetical protein